MCSRCSLSNWFFHCCLYTMTTVYMISWKWNFHSCPACTSNQKLLMLALIGCSFRFLYAQYHNSVSWFVEIMLLWLFENFCWAMKRKNFIPAPILVTLIGYTGFICGLANVFISWIQYFSHERVVKEEKKTWHLLPGVRITQIEMYRLYFKPVIVVREIKAFH